MLIFRDQDDKGKKGPVNPWPKPLDRFDFILLLSLEVTLP